MTRTPLRDGPRCPGLGDATLAADAVTWNIEGAMAAHSEREVQLAPSTDGMLATIIQRVVDGRAEPTEVTAVLRRVCEESRERPPELLLLRVKELWT